MAIKRFCVECENEKTTRQTIRGEDYCFYCLRDTKSKVVIVEEFKEALLKPSKLRTRTINEYGFNLKGKPKVFTRISNKGNRIFFSKKAILSIKFLLKRQMVQF